MIRKQVKVIYWDVSLVQMFVIQIPTAETKSKNKVIAKGILLIRIFSSLDFRSSFKLRFRRKTFEVPEIIADKENMMKRGTHYWRHAQSSNGLKEGGKEQAWENLCI